MSNEISVEDIKWWLKEEYPITIVADRYCGSYSKGAFTCWPLDWHELPEAIGDSDCACMDFWASYDINYVGLGSTPQDALNDLKAKLAAICERQVS